VTKASPKKRGRPKKGEERPKTMSSWKGKPPV